MFGFREFGILLLGKVDRARDSPICPQFEGERDDAAQVLFLAGFSGPGYSADLGTISWFKCTIPLRRAQAQWFKTKSRLYRHVTLLSDTTKSSQTRTHITRIGPNNTRESLGISSWKPDNGHLDQPERHHICFSRALLNPKP